MTQKSDLPFNDLPATTHNSRTQELEKALTEMSQLQAILKLRREKPPIMVNTNAKFRRWQRTYCGDLLAFAHDMFEFRDGEGPVIYQDEMLSVLPTHHRVAQYGPRGLGKTTGGSWAVLWAVTTVEDVKAPTTASSWRQLQKYLWPEIHKWVGRLKWDKMGIPPFVRNKQLKTYELELSKTATAFAVASNDYNKIEGAHARDRVFCEFDESKAVPENTFNSMEGAFAMTTEPLALAMSTPGPKIGRFYDICTHAEGYEEWYVIHVSMEDAIKAGRMDPDWARKRARQWGEDSAIYRNHVLGEFAADSARTVIPIHHVELAQARWDYIMKEGQVGSITAIGVDVARGGEDVTAVALAAGSTIVDIITWDFDDTMKIVDGLIPMMNANPLARAVIDVIGVGAGVYDRLSQLFGDRVVAFNVSEKTSTADRSGQLTFKNKRSWSWWKMRELLDPGYGSVVALPPDDGLVGELTTPKYEDERGVMVVESKESIRSLLSRSTNKADAVINALAAVEICESSRVEIISYQEYLEKLGVA
jgi:hypothetical protein